MANNHDSDTFPVEQDLFSQQCGANNLQIQEERVVSRIIEIEAHLIRVYHLIVVFLRIIHHSQQMFLVSVLQSGRSRDARPQGKDFTSLALQLVSIAGHIRTWSHHAHLPSKDIPELGQLIQFSSTEEGPQFRDTTVSRHRDSGAITSPRHGTKLMHDEQFTILPHPALAEEDRSSIHQTNQQSNQQQNP